LAALPQGVGFRLLLGAGVLAGIGFTMAIFLTTLAFKDPALVAASKLGVMVASVLAASCASALLARSLPREGSAERWFGAEPRGPGTPAACQAENPPSTWSRSFAPAFASASSPARARGPLWQ